MASPSVPLETAKMLHEQGWLKTRFDGQFEKEEFPDVWCLYYDPNMSEGDRWHATFLHYLDGCDSYYSYWSETVEAALEWVEQMRREIEDEN